VTTIDATPLFSDAEPIGVPPSKKATVGVSPSAPETVAVKVTPWPKAVGVPEEAIAVEVPSTELFTGTR
jgi:hypothetical protein